MNRITVLLVLSGLSQVIFAQDTLKGNLTEIEVSASKTKNEEPVTFGKAGIKPIDLPQAVASIDRTVIDQQQQTRLSDAMKNFNGVYIMGSTGGYQEEIAGRGFAFSNSNTFKNGIRFNNSAMPEMSALERIEVMKGSAAILFGNVAAGGVLNLVTKKPKSGKGGEVTFQTGSFDFYKPSIDVFGSVDKKEKISYRVNTTYEKTRSFREVVKGERFYINPSFLFKLGKSTSLLVEGDYLKDDRTADFGVGAINYELSGVPRERFIGVDWSYIRTEQKGATATLTHSLTKNWKISSITSYQAFSNDLFANQRPNGNSQFIRTDGRWIRGLQRTKIEEEYSITQLDLTGKFRTWILNHNLLFGADADQYFTDNDAYNPLNTYDTINVFEPGKYKERKDIPDLTKKTTTNSPNRRLGVYVQDLIEITKYVKLLAGVRFSYIETFSRTYTHSNGVELRTNLFDHAFTPRLGLVVQPKENLSFFASYANSFTQNTGVDINNKPLAPSFIDQYEAGFKSDLFKGALSANVTAYQIVNSNLAQTSLENGNTNTNIKELAGEVTSKGVEVDVNAKPVKGLNIIAGYSFNETKYTKSNTYIVGSLLRYNPNHTANLSVHYTYEKPNLLNGLNGGISCLYFGERYAGRSTRVQVVNDTYKIFKLPAYLQIDASLGYSMDKCSIRFKVSNILDELSYNVHDDNSVNPIAPRTFTTTLGFKF